MYKDTVLDLVNGGRTLISVSVMATTCHLTAFPYITKRIGSVALWGFCTFTMWNSANILLHCPSPCMSWRWLLVILSLIADWPDSIIWLITTPFHDVANCHVPLWYGLMPHLVHSLAFCHFCLCTIVLQFYTHSLNGINCPSSQWYVCACMTNVTGRFCLYACVCVLLDVLMWCVWVREWMHECMYAYHCLSWQS